MGGRKTGITPCVFGARHRSSGHISSTADFWHEVRYAEKELGRLGCVVVICVWWIITTIWNGRSLWAVIYNTVNLLGHARNEFQNTDWYFYAVIFREFRGTRICAILQQLLLTRRWLCCDELTFRSWLFCAVLYRFSALSRWGIALPTDHPQHVNTNCNERRHVAIICATHHPSTKTILPTKKLS